MINRPKVIQGFKGLVGYENPADPTYAFVSEENQTSESGYTFNENPLVKLTYLHDTQDYSSISSTDFNVLLKSIKERSITDILHKVFNKPGLIDRQVLYRYANNKVETEDLPEGFVGYKIEQASRNNFAFEISRVLLEFQGTGTIKLLLFNTAQKDPVKSKEVTINSSNQIEELNWRLDNTDNYFKGEFYFGYLTQGLTVEPYKRDYELSEVRSDIKGLYIQRKVITGHDSETLFDLDKEESSDLTFGLNPDITTFYDYTDTAIQNRMLFARAIQLQGQINILNEYIATSRTNRNTRITQELINKVTVELEGRDAEGITKVGLKDKLKGEVNHIQSEINKLQGNYQKKAFKTITSG